MNGKLAWALNNLNNAIEEKDKIEMEEITELNKLLGNMISDMKLYSDIIEKLGCDSYCSSTFRILSVEFTFTIYETSENFAYFDINEYLKNGKSTLVHHIGYNMSFTKSMRRTNGFYDKLVEIVKNWNLYKRYIENELASLCEDKAIEIRVSLAKKKKVEEN